MDNPEPECGGGYGAARENYAQAKGDYAQFLERREHPGISPAMLAAGEQAMLKYYGLDGIPQSWVRNAAIEVFEAMMSAKTAAF
jgi:hypothetical protein